MILKYTARNCFLKISTCLLFALISCDQLNAFEPPPKADFIVKAEIDRWNWTSYFSTRGDFRDEGLVGWMESDTDENGNYWSRYFFDGIEGDFETDWLPDLPDEDREYIFMPLYATGPYRDAIFVATARISYTRVWFVDSTNTRQRLVVPVVQWTMEGFYLP
jgi:hypothetical protein